MFRLRQLQWLLRLLRMWDLLRFLLLRLFRLLLLFWMLEILRRRLSGRLQVLMFHHLFYHVLRYVLKPVLRRRVRWDVKIL